MPTYQYRCTACGHDLEATQKFSDPSLTECPNCGGSLRKVFNAVGVVFKGSGFYRTDSRGGAKERFGLRRRRLGPAAEVRRCERQAGEEGTASPAAGSSTGERPRPAALIHSR